MSDVFKIEDLKYSEPDDNNNDTYDEYYNHIMSIRKKINEILKEEYSKGHDYYHYPPLSEIKKNN
jgi:hypothetical protein